MLYKDITISGKEKVNSLQGEIFALRNQNNQKNQTRKERNAQHLQTWLKKFFSSKKLQAQQLDEHKYSNRNLREETIDNVKTSTHQCFSFFNEALQNARNLKYLNLSGMSLEPILALELAQGIQKNTSLQEINLSGCSLNNSSLQCIFHSISNHQTLQSINFFNNQDFNIDLVYDMVQFLFKGKNNLQKLKLTHCNIPSTALSILLRHLKFSKSITSLDISMMELTPDALTSLGIALQHYKGKKSLESLNLGYSNIKNQGLEILLQRVQWNMRKINIKELIFKKSGINQKGVSFLEAFLKQIGQLQRLDLSQNALDEINCQYLLQRYLYEINLSSNLFSNFQPNFFLNTIVINLSCNNIKSQGAFQLASILRQNPLWIELNLSNNQIKSEGFNSIIFGLRDNRMLKKLIVANNNLDGEALITYMVNHEQVNFENLDISLNSIRYQLVLFVLKFIKGGQLKYFRCTNLKQDDQQFDLADMNKKQLTNEELSYQYQQIQQSSFQFSTFNLRYLDFSNNPYIFTSVITSLATYYNKIEVLNLSSCKPVNEFDIEQVCILLKKSSTLHDLDLSNLNLGYNSPEILSKLRQTILISSLKCANLSRNKLFLSVIKIVKNTKNICNFRLEKMDYSFNGFTSQHSYFLENILPNFQNLTELNLSHNSFDTSALIHILSFLRNNKVLKHLDLSYQNLSSDDLLVISSMINTGNLYSLNLSNNKEIRRQKLFFNLCCSQRLEFLNLNHIFFDKYKLKDTEKLLKKQRKNIRSVILDQCYFQKVGYEQLADQFAIMKNLQLFAIKNNPLLYLDLEKTAKLLYQSKTLRIFQSQQITFSDNCLFQFSQWLQNINCPLEILDIREYQLKQSQFNVLCDGLAGSKRLKNIYLIQCDLGNLSLTSLGQVISLNENIEVVSLENNGITSNLLSLGNGINQYNRHVELKVLNVSNNPLIQSSMAVFLSNQQLKVQELNLSGCYLLKSESLSQKIVNFSFLQKLQCLQLSKNKLSDIFSYRLGEILSQLQCLKELYLQENLFSSQGITIILRNVLEIQTIKLIDIRYNDFDDQLIENLVELIEPNIQLQFLRLRKKDNFSKNGIKTLMNILKGQQENFFFIDNIWEGIDDDDADIILQQYTKISKNFRLKSQILPDFLKEILMANSNLTDKFCELFGKYYPLLNFIELVDISDNPYITMYGKVYLFFHLFDQSYEMHSLKVMCIYESQETPKFFDDGLLRYLIFSFRNFLLQNNKGIKQQNDILKFTNRNQVLFGFIGTWVVHLINMLLLYLDSIEPPTFLVSTLFIGKFRRNNSNIKFLTCFFWVLFILVNVIQFHTLIIESNSQFFQCELSTILNYKCNEVELPPKKMETIFTIFHTLLVACIEIGQLIFMVKLRRKIQPALQIVHPKIMEQLHSKLPSKREVGLMIYSFFRKYSTFPERNFLPLLMRINHTEVNIQTYQILLAVIIFSRFLDQIIHSLFNLFQFMKINPQQDQARYLSLLQRNFYYMNYFIPSDILKQLCPVQGYQLNKRFKINYQILIELYRIIIFDIFLLIVLRSFFYEYQISFQLYIKNAQPNFQMQIMFILTFSSISIISSLFIILTAKPAVVRQNGFNLSLGLKRYQKSKQQFVQPSDIKVEETIEKAISKSHKIREKMIQNYSESEKNSSQTLNEAMESQDIDFIEEKSAKISIQDLMNDEIIHEGARKPFVLKNPKQKIEL